MDDFLKDFVDSPTVEDQVVALQALIKHRLLFQSVKNPSFELGLNRLAECATNTAGRDQERLIAIAALRRIGNVVRGMRKYLNELIRPALATRLPPLEVLPQPDDRFQVVSAWQVAGESWWVDYLARSAVYEEAAERVRAESVRGLISLAPDLTSAMESLNGALQTLRFETAFPAESMARRIRRVLTALKTSLGKAPVEPGRDPGSQLAKLVGESFRSAGRPNDDALKSEVVRGTAAVVHELVRARFSLGTVATTYAAIDVVRSWYKELEWTRLANRSDTLGMVTTDILEALRLLVQAGITDDELVHRLALTTGSFEKARERCKQLANQLPGLPEEISDWLLGRGRRKQSELATESQYRAVDEIIADLLIESRNLLQATETIKERLLPEITILAPQLAETLRGLVSSSQSILNVLQYLAARRSLRIRGKPGENAAFSPLEHEIAGGPRPGSGRVRILHPAVETVEPDGTVRIVRKALVEPINNFPGAEDGGAVR